MIEFLIYLVPLLYGGIQALEMSSILGRYSGYVSGRSMTGYALQQSIYMGTRFLFVFLLPILGLAVDSGIEQRQFAWLSHLSLLSAAILGLIVLAGRRKIVRYYRGVLAHFDQGGSFLRSFFRLPDEGTPRDQMPLKMPGTKRDFWLSVIVFTIYSSGLFISFYFAVIIPEYRASISQLSGVINALGAFLLTFFIEPHISRGIDVDAPDAGALILSLLYGRLISVVLTAQILLFLVFFL